MLTLAYLNRIFEQRKNYDLRRLLSGAERLIDHLLSFMETEPAFMLGAVRCLPLNNSVRDSITQTISSACSKVKVSIYIPLERYFFGTRYLTIEKLRPEHTFIILK